jgi:PEP-CTERM motif
LDQNGGALSTAANAQSVVSVPYTDANSSASLSSGALTAYSAAGSASASIWDTFTYSDLPSGEALIEATLTLPGTLTGYSSGSAILESGSQADFTNSTEAMSYAAFDKADPKPASISLMFEVTDGTPVTVFSEIVAFGDGAGGVADLADPPTLSLTLPVGASVAIASGVFDNFISAAVPEPSTWAMMIAGVFGISGLTWRRRATELSTL